MRRMLLAVGIVALCLAPLRADVTIVQTMTMEGPMTAAMGDAQTKMTMHIKGMKARSDAEMMGMNISSIIDLDAKTVTILNLKEKTAQVMTAGAPDKPTMKLPDMDVEYKATGQTRTIEGQPCDEHTFVLKMNFSDMSPPGQQLPPEAAEMMKDLRFIANGSMWIAKAGPGAAEFIAFQKAAAEANLLSAMLGGMATGAGSGLDKLMKATTSAPGVPYLMEITMSVEGTGPMVEMMKQMGAMKMVQKTTSVTTEPVSDGLFKVPEGYTVEKK